MKKGKIIFIAIFMVYIVLTAFVTIKDNFSTINDNIDKILKSDKYKKEDFSGKVSLIKNSFENDFNKNIYGKNNYIDTYGLFQRLMNKKIVQDFDDSKRVVKMNNGKLTFVYPQKSIKNYSNKITALSNYAKENGIYMLYINIPWRIKDNSKLPFYVKDYVTETNDNMLKSISNNGVNILDLENLLPGERNEWFYDTDHHWTTDTAFEAYKIIIKDLDKNLNLGLTDKYLNNFTRKEYRNIFLGTYGKRVGKYYGGVDDFTYIYPYFKTNFLVTNYRNVGEVESQLRGNFNDTMTYPEFLKTDSLDREMSVYYTYSKGTKAEIVVSNLDAYNDKKLLILKDSFADNIYPFLSLNFKQTKVIDIRRYKNIWLYKYIQKYQPDAILFLQNAQSLYDESLIKFQEK